MGWDFICTYIATRIPLTPDPEFWIKLEKELDGRVDKMSDEELIDWCNEIGTMDEVDEARIAAHGIVATIIKTLQDDYCREIQKIVVGDYKLWLAGGMSNGGDPSDTYNDFNNFNALFTEQFLDTYLGDKNV